MAAAPPGSTSSTCCPRAATPASAPPWCRRPSPRHAPPARCAVDLEIESGHERVASLYRRAGFAPLSRQRWSLRVPATATPTPAAPTALAGGCCCGAVRYAIEAEADDVTHCHCTLCRRSSGAPVVTWLTVPRSALRLLSGTPRERRSSAHAVRTFCADCGTPIAFRSDLQPDTLDVTVGSLDTPELITPREHIWVRSALAVDAARRRSAAVREHERSQWP